VATRYFLNLTKMNQFSFGQAAKKVGDLVELLVIARPFKVFFLAFHDDLNLLCADSFRTSGLRPRQRGLYCPYCRIRLPGPLLKL